MRTKTLLITAALSVAGLASSMAQAVYSVNAVGFVNVTVPTNFSIIANPLNSSDNHITNLFTAVPDGTTIYKFDGTNYTINSAIVLPPDPPIWDRPEDTLVPGEAAFIRNPSGAAFTVTFVGEVPQGALSNSLPANFSLKASQVPQSARLDTTPTVKGLDFPAADGDTIYLFRNNNYFITSFFADPAGGIWDNGDPIPNVGEGFFVRKQTPVVWSRNFSVNTP